MSRPALHLVVDLEEPVEARVVAFSFADELRLADDLPSRPRLVRDVQDALENALDVMRARRAGAVPGDLAA